MIIDRDHVRVGNWVCQRTGGQYTSDAVGIGWEKEGKLLAGVLYDGYNGASIRMHVAGEGSRWMTRTYLWFCFHYPFSQLGVRKVIGLVPSVNWEALRFDQHLGFVEEARISDAHPKGDIVILTMTRSQCRFLELRHGQQIRSACTA